MKYILLFTLVIVVILFVSRYLDKQEKIAIVSELVFKGETSIGVQEFVFSLINIGNNEVVLQFPTGLEYNFSIGYLSNQNIPSGTLQFEHKDINIDDPNGRSVLLKPNERIQYTFLIKGLPSGEYDIYIESASGYGGTIYQKFIVE